MDKKNAKKPDLVAVELAEIKTAVANIIATSENHMRELRDSIGKNKDLIEGVNLSIAIIQAQYEAMKSKLDQVSPVWGLVNRMFNGIGQLIMEGGAVIKTIVVGAVMGAVLIISFGVMNWFVDVNKAVDNVSKAVDMTSDVVNKHVQGSKNEE